MLSSSLSERLGFSDPITPKSTLALANRFALREMRGGLKGFMIFLACIALGVAAIGGVNSVSRAITAGVVNEGQSILGGDIRFELNQRETTPVEDRYLEDLGLVARSASIRSMARLADGSDQTLVQARAVDDLFPLFGEFVTEPALSREALFGKNDGNYGATAPQILFDRLGVEIGDVLLFGTTKIQLRAKLIKEPDLASEGFAFAPRLMMDLAAMRASGLIRPGSLVEHGYKIKLKEGLNPEAVKAKATTDLPESGWSIRTSNNASPALSNNIKRFSQFLTLVGLTALVVGGVGVANAVRAYLDGKRSVIATYKCLGAGGNFVVQVYAIQIFYLALIGISVGLVFAALMPVIAGWALSNILPFQTGSGLYPDALASAALFGALATALFATLPLGSAHQVAATALFRERSLGDNSELKWKFCLTALIFALVFAGCAILLSEESRVAAGFLGGVTAAFLVLRFVALGIQALAKRAPTVRSTPLRLAIGNIHRPGALTPSVVLSLGLGLTLLVTIALIDGSLRRQLADSLPEAAPNFFFVDIPAQDADRFADKLAELEPNGKLIRVPMLRGRVIALNDIPVSDIEVPPSGRWVLRGDRGITYAKNLPENSKLDSGTWWQPDHTGSNLVSFAAEEAGELGLVVGDTVTVNVLGRNITATIANLRDVQWGSLGINFVMVFSPNTFAGAPHSWLATLNMDNPTPENEGIILNQVTNTFPSVTSVRVKDALDVVNQVVGQLGTAIRVAASVALIASILVLSGALAAGNQARIRDAVVLKTLGATRRTLIAAYTLEYMILGIATALFALAAGGLAAWAVVTQLMGLQLASLPGVALATVATALIFTVGFGLIGTWRILGFKAASFLRES